MTLDTFRLAFILGKAQFMLRIAGRYLGIFWYLLEPLTYFLLFLLLQANLQTGTIFHYPAYLLLGLIMGNFFMSATSGALRSMRDNANLIKSMNIALEVFPLSAVIQFCFSHFFEFALFLIIAFCYHDLSWTAALYPIIFIPFLGFVMGSALIVATVGVFVEDLVNVWAVLSRLIWLATPIFYVATVGTISYRLSFFNPLFYFIVVARQVIVYSLVPSWQATGAMLTASIVFLTVGLVVFRTFKSRFAEYL